MLGPIYFLKLLWAQHGSQAAKEGRGFWHMPQHGRTLRTVIMLGKVSQTREDRGCEALLPRGPWRRQIQKVRGRCQRGVTEWAQNFPVESGDTSWTRIVVTGAHQAGKFFMSVNCPLKNGHSRGLSQSQGTQLPVQLPVNVRERQLMMVRMLGYLPSTWSCRLNSRRLLSA